MLLFDSDLQVISSSSHTSNLKVSWIKQQEITTNTNQMGTLPQQQTSQSTDCNKSDGSCKPTSQIIQNPGNYQRDVTVTKPKEELPLKWEIPHKLLNSHVRQASLKLWTGTKIDLE